MEKTIIGLVIIIFGISLIISLLEKILKILKEIKSLNLEFHIRKKDLLKHTISLNDKQLTELKESNNLQEKYYKRIK